LHENEFKGQAMYFIAQAAEKAARAIIEASGLYAGTTHSFDQLGSKLNVDHPYRERILDFDEALSGASTRYRYPTESGQVREPTYSNVEKYLGDVAEFIEEARRFIVSTHFNFRR
jgi:HEPN domain-containing protein